MCIREKVKKNKNKYHVHHHQRKSLSVNNLWMVMTSIRKRSEKKNKKNLDYFLSLFNVPSKMKKKKKTYTFKKSILPAIQEQER
jgi:hypothetical protein